MCCLHGIPSQPDLSSLDKSQLGATLYNSSCVQPTLLSASLHQSQQLQRCWDPHSSSALQPPSKSSPVSIMAPIQLKCSRGSSSQPQAAPSQPLSQAKSYFYHHHQREAVLDSHAQLSADRSRLVQGQMQSQCQGKVSTNTALQQKLNHKAIERDVMTVENWEERCRVEEAHGQTAVVEHRELLDEEVLQNRREQSPVQQQHHFQASPAAELRREQQRTRPTLMLRDHQDGRVRD